MTNALRITAQSRAATPRQGRKANPLLRGKSIYPPPVAIAEFAGGEKIRMTFWQQAGRPWDFGHARRLLAQAIGNERGRGGSAYAAATADLDRKIAAARAIAADLGINLEEADTARKGVERLEKRRLAKIKEAQTAVLDAVSTKFRGFPRATDFIEFYVEHDGKIIDPATLPANPPRARLMSKSSAPDRLPSPATAANAPAPIEIAALMTEIETRLGEGFLDTKAWRRVRARIKAVTKPDKSLAA